MRYERLRYDDAPVLLRTERQRWYESWRAYATGVAKVKNHQFIAGLVQPTQDKAENHVKDTQHFTMKTKQTFWDGFLAGITYGIYTPSTTYYYEPAK